MLGCLAAPAYAAPGDIFTFAGAGPALDNPTGVAWLADGSVLVAEYEGHRVRRISPSGTISTVAGSGTAGFSGNGGPATSARLNAPTDVEATADGGFLIADLGNRRVRKVSAGGTITTVAGTGEEGSSGNGGPATSARLVAPAGVASLPQGGFLIADAGGNRVRQVSGAGIITTVAGTGSAGGAGDGDPATSAQLAAPVGIAALPGGGFLVGEYEGHRVRRVSAGGIIARVAGTGSDGFSGDGGAAAAARLNRPVGISPTSDGGFLVGDSQNHRVRKVSPDGSIATVAGTGQAGYSGDGGPAALARLNSPNAAVEGIDGAIMIADGANNRLRLMQGRPPASPPAPPAAPPAAHGLLLGEIGRAVFATPNGTLRLPVSCPVTATERCRGTIRLVLQTRARRRRASAAKAIVIARRRFSVAPGRRQAVKLRLSRSARRLLRRGRTLKVKAVVARRGGPNIGKRSERVALKVKQKRRPRGRRSGGRG